MAKSDKILKIIACGLASLLAMSLIAFGVFKLVGFFEVRLVGYAVMVIVFCLIAIVFGQSANERLSIIAVIIFVPYLGFGLALFLMLEKLFAKKRTVSNRNSYFIDAQAKLDLTFRDYAKVASYVDYRTHFPVLFSEDIEFFENSFNYLTAIVEEIEKAQNYVLLEFYILKRGKMFSKLMNALFEALERNVKVSINVDYFGTGDFSKSEEAEMLTEKGANILTYKRPKLFLGMWHNVRTHRKIVVIDGETAFLGGINFSDDELEIKDCGVKLRGDAAKQAETMFYRLSGQKVTFDYDTKDKGKGFVQPFSVYGKKTIEGIYLGALNASKREILICTPYLSISDDIMQSFAFLLESGVRVKILIPQKSSKIVKRVNFYYAEKLKRLGAEIHCYNKSFIHSKTIIIDKKMLVSGSPNFDLRSSSYQIESGIIIYDNRVIDEFLLDFNLCLADSSPFETVKHNKFFGRIINSFVRLFAYFF